MSWPPTVPTWNAAPPKPRTGPSTVPGRMGSRKSERGAPAASSRFHAQVRVERSIAFEVEAMVASLAATPESQ